MSVSRRATGRRAVSAVSAGLLAASLSGCGLASDVHDAVFGLQCTQVGLDEGVSVDLTAVLPFEGEYQVTLSMPELQESIPVTLSGNTENGLFIADSVDLDGDAVQVQVEARDATGAVVYRGAGAREPELDQPNGPRCDPDNYWLSLQATKAGDLVPIPRFEPVRDEQGRVSMWVYTSCGVRYLDSPYRDGGSYVRVGGPLDDGVGGPPAGWAVPLQRGWIAAEGEGVVFEDERGHRETFRPWSDSDYYEQCTRSS